MWLCGATTSKRRRLLSIYTPAEKHHSLSTDADARKIKDREGYPDSVGPIGILGTDKRTPPLAPKTPDVRSGQYRAAGVQYVTCRTPTVPTCRLHVHLPCSPALCRTHLPPLSLKSALDRYTLFLNRLGRYVRSASSRRSSSTARRSGRSSRRPCHIAGNQTRRRPGKARARPPLPPHLPPRRTEAHCMGGMARRWTRCPSASPYCFTTQSSQYHSLPDGASRKVWQWPLT